MMNRRAVVLAADSATTVRYQTAEGMKERYFKGANKIIQLSAHRPVGLMIFDSADILGVPWEVVVKTFRDELATKAFPSVAQYAETFFDFLSANRLLFPDDVRKNSFLQAARIAALQTVVRTDREGTEVERRARVDQAIADAQNAVESVPFPPNIDHAFMNELVGQWTEELVPMIAEWLQDFDVVTPTDLHPLARLGIVRTVKIPEDYLGTTGLVFAGFGEGDVFPHMVEFKSCGLASGRHIARRGEDMAINHAIPAWLSAFAQTSMSDTFLMGFSKDVFIEVMGKVAVGLTELLDSALAAVGADPSQLPNRATLIDAARTRIGDQVLGIAQTQHATPLRRVLGSLPVDEMAELAETLVNLQSLKEKVTQPSETVGGPVDVAAITKSEGLVWIKRKHFFDPALNSRYLQRQAATYS